jgi:Protein of unknown function (DUF3828)
MNLAHVVLALGLLQPVSTSSSAEAFVRNLYQREAHETNADEQAFAGYGGAEAIYSPSLLALIRQDIRRTPKGDIGKLDYDPICGCQDSDGIAVQALRLVPIDQSNARALVTLRFGGADQSEIALKLVRLPTGWRVDDVDGSKGFKPLRNLLASRK